MVTAVIVGVGKWELYTLPCIKSLQEHVPDVQIVCVDNGSKYPDMDGVKMLRTDNVVCYATALNIGIKAVDSDWYIAMNNDLLITRPFSVKELKANKIYGFIKYSFASGFDYVPSWGMFIHQDTIDKIGYFDEALKPMWFEDADYCVRAVIAGIDLVVLERKDWGFYHIEDERQPERHGYMQQNMIHRRRNRQYVERKHGL